MDMKKILQAMDSVSTKPVEGSDSMKKFLQVVTEGANPHKVALPVQMAMQHYQQPKAEPVVKKSSLLKQYFSEAENTVAEHLAEQEADRKQRLKMYSQKIAERVLVKESALKETPIEMTGDANDPVVYGHEKANPMSLKGRIQQARNQLKELAQMSESDDLVVWEQITKLHAGGMFMGLAQNLEQIRHGIEELAAKRSKGGVGSRDIDKRIGEDNDPCWDNYKMVGTKKKGSKTVPNCVPKK
jgi:hypothetical protein